MPARRRRQAERASGPQEEGAEAHPRPGEGGPGRPFLLTMGAMALFSAGVLLWPLVGFGAAVAVAWMVALAWALYRRRRWLRRWNLWLGSLALIPLVDAGLFLWEPRWSGRLGPLVSGGVGVMAYGRVAGLFLLAWALLLPRLFLRSASLLGRGLVLLARALARALAGAAALYRRAPLHRLPGVLARATWAGMVRAGSALRPPPSPEARAVGLLREAFRRAYQGESLSTPPPEPLPPPPQRVEGEAGPKGALPPAPALGGWSPPPIALLQRRAEATVSEEESQQKARLIEETLADYGIEVSVQEIRPGPTVTLYGLVPGWVRKYKEVRERDKEGRPKLDRNGKPVIRQVEEKTRVRVDTILAREKDLALALAAPSIRFEAPVPGEPFIGLEVPNTRPSVVSLRGVMESPQFQEMARKASLPIALGRGSGGEPVVADLAEMPHLLIAGSTGSGKSVCINSIIACLLMRQTPFDLRLVMVDPKRVELTPYNGIPHLLAPVIVEPERVVQVLKGIIGEMLRRYKQLEGAGVRNIQGYNRRAQAPEERMPFLVVVVDELADLMMSAPVEVEHTITRLAQLGRAVGIHLVVATQRPSVDVITGLIKANFPSRISFAVSSQVDSRTIIDMAGAEKLLGKGDMLFLPVNLPKPKRLQGVYISDEEIEALVDHWRAQQGQAPPPVSLAPPEEEQDELLEKARDLCRRHSRVSVSLLQRKLGVGYNRAARLMEQLEELGVVAPGEPGRARQVIGPRGQDEAG